MNDEYTLATKKAWGYFLPNSMAYINPYSIAALTAKGFHEIVREGQLKGYIFFIS